MYTLDKIKQEITDIINKALKKNIIQVSSFVYPPQFNMGDLSLPCFNIAKESGKTPAAAARELYDAFKKKNILAIKSLSLAGPYLNIYLNNDLISAEALKEIEKQKDSYGYNKRGRKRRVMVEFSNANTHKQIHVGHLRNICFGDAITKIMAANGYLSIPVSYVNDFGSFTAKTIWAYLKYYKDEELPENKGAFLGSVYVRAAKELEKNEDVKSEIEKIMKKIESRSGREYEIWQETRKWSITQFENIDQELGVKLESRYYESNFIERGKDIVADLYEKRILKKSDGAIIADLSEYGLGVQVFMRSDGTAMYGVADLGLAEAKEKEAEVSIYITDIRQSLHFKQLFKLLDLNGNKQEKIHLGHEFVKLTTGMMASRSGNIITYEDLRGRLMARAENETGERHKDWNKNKISRTASAIVNGAIKFEMLKVGVNQVITFDIEKALRFEGFTAAYLQYTYARIQSILRKSEVRSPASLKLQGINKKLEVCHNKLTEEKEHEIVMKLAKYPEAVIRAGEKYDPSEIAKFIFELARDLNDYYHSVPVLKAEKEIRHARLALIEAANQIIKNGFYLLGIDVVNEM